MTVSIEWFVVQNLGMNAAVLGLAARMAGVRVRWWQVALGAALGCGYAVCAYLPWGKWLLGVAPRTVVCVGMTFAVCSGRRVSDRRRTLRAFFFVWVCTLLLGGTGAGVMYLMGSAGYGVVPALCAAVVGAGVIVGLTAQRNRVKGNVLVRLTVEHGGKRVTFPAVVDTGNVLVEPVSNLPVIVVERRMVRGMEECGRRFAVPFASVGGAGELSGFFPRRVFVDGKEVDAVVAVFDGRLCMEGCGLVPGGLMVSE